MPCTPEMPIYAHPLPTIENWLRSLDCEQDREALNHWMIARDGWQADLWMEVDCFLVSYRKAAVDGSDLERSFKYSLSRQDVEAAIFAGP